MAHANVSFAPVPPLGEVSVALFGGLKIVGDGRDVTEALPGHQGRLLFAYVAAHWPEAVTRESAYTLFWGDPLPDNVSGRFRPLLRKTREPLWDDAISGRETLRLSLPDGARFDLRDALEGLERVERGEAGLEAAELAVETFSREFLVGFQADFVQVRAREFEDYHRRALEAVAQLAPPERAEQAARRLVQLFPLRERGWELLIEAQIALDNVNEALATYDELVRLLRERQDSRPSDRLRELHAELLRLTDEPPPPAAPVQVGGFVGREEQLATLRSAWRRASTGPAEIVLLDGPAGIGKTRLARQFAAEVAADGGAVLYGRADQEALTTFQPFVEALGQLLRDGNETFAGDREILGRLLPDLGPGGDEATGAESDPALRFRFFQAVAALLARAGSTWPLLLILDDLHWADKPTLMLLRHLLRAPGLRRVLVIGTLRPETGEALADFLHLLYRDRGTDPVVLGGLDLEGVRALVRDRLGQAPPAGVLERLLGLTRGNAFFIEEILRALGPGGLDEAALDRVGVPKGVKEVILRHVRTLSPAAQELLTMAAVIGRQAPFDVLERLFADALSPLSEALDARLIEPAESPEVTAFTHALVRETLYGELRGPLLTRAHLRVAEAIKAGPEPHNPAELAHHYALAARPGPARHYSRLAGQQAARLFSYDEAATHYRRALDLLGEADERERCDLLLDLARVYYFSGDPRARETYQAALDSARARGAAEQFARATLGLGARFWEAAYAGSQLRELLEEAVGLVTEADGLWRARVLARLAETLAFLGEDGAAAAWAGEALDLGRRLGDQDVLVQTLLARHISRLDIEHLDERLELMDELVALGDGHAERGAECRHWRLYDLLEAGDVRAARAEHARLAELAAELRRPLFDLLAAGWTAALADLAGDRAAADEWAQQLPGLAERARARDGESTWASQVFARRRREGTLSSLADVTERLARKGRAGWLPALGILHAELGDHAAAAAVLVQCGPPEAVPEGPFRLVTLALMADLSALVGDRSPALYAALAPYAHRWVVIGYSSCWGPVDAFLALLAEGADAERHARAAHARVLEIGAPLLASDIEQRHPRVTGWSSTA